MKQLFILILLPIVTFAQKTNDNWITPVADIEFKNGKVIYITSVERQSYLDRILPLAHSENTLTIKTVPVKGYLDHKSFEELQISVFDYLSDWSIQYSDNRDKHRFLKYCCLQIIWSSNIHCNLPENAIEALGILKDDLSIVTSENATLVLELYDSYKK